MIKRLAESNAATLNQALTDLQARYEVIGNVEEIISSGTLSADVPQLSFSLNGLPWRALRLQASMQLNKNVYAALRANEDNGPSYHSWSAQGGTPYIVDTKVSSVRGLFGDAGAVASVDLWLLLNDVGFILRGNGADWLGSSWAFNATTQEWNPASSALSYHKFAGFYHGGPVTSLQLVIPSEQDRSPVPVDPRFKAGGYWQLTGLRP